MKKLKIGIIGLGQRGASLLGTALACEEAEVVALCDLYPDRTEAAVRRVKEAGGHATAYENYRDLLADPETEAVIVASSWDFHIRQAIDSMRAGKITGMEVGGAYSVEECWELVRTQEETGVPFMFLENCCYDKFELLTTSLVRAGKLGEIVHCHGAYRHDLRHEVARGRVARHYRLENYRRRNCENYPTHEFGPIARILGINRGNKMLSLVSVASRAVGMEAYLKTEKNPDPTLAGCRFSQGDIVNTVITCADGSTVSLTLDTTLPTFYSREFTVAGTKGRCMQDINAVLLDSDKELERDFVPAVSSRKFLDNAENFREYLPSFWRDITEEERRLGHGGMDYFMLRSFLDAAINGGEMPIDVYDAAAWMCITALSEASIAAGGAPQPIPDFTSGMWVNRSQKDVVPLPTPEK